MIKISSDSVYTSLTRAQWEREQEQVEADQEEHRKRVENRTDASILEAAEALVRLVTLPQISNLIVEISWMMFGDEGELRLVRIHRVQGPSWSDRRNVRAIMVLDNNGLRNTEFDDYVHPGEFGGVVQKFEIFADEVEELIALITAD